MPVSGLTDDQVGWLDRALADDQVNGSVIRQTGVTRWKCWTGR